MELVDPNATKESAVQALGFCISKGYEDVVDALLQTHFRDTRLSDMAEKCTGVLVQAVNSGSYDMLCSILSYIDDDYLFKEQHMDKSMVTKLLCRAVENDNQGMVELLLKRKGNPNAFTHGAPLLHRSVLNGNLAISRILLDAGADLHCTDNKGQSVFVSAILSKKGNALGWLLSLGVDPKKKLSSGKEAIHIAAAHSKDAVLRLVEAGCDVNARDEINGDTPLHVACWRSCGETIESLVRTGAKMNLTNNQGETPLAKLLKFATDVHNFHSQSRIKLARILVKIGFRILPREQKSSTSNYCIRRKGRDKVEDLYKQIMQKSNNTCSLQLLCSLVIRNTLHGEKVKLSLQELDIPHHLKDLILFKDFNIDSTYSM